MYLEIRLSKLKQQAIEIFGNIVADCMMYSKDKEVTIIVTFINNRAISYDLDSWKDLKYNCSDEKTKEVRHNAAKAIFGIK